MGTTIRTQRVEPGLYLVRRGSTFFLAELVDNAWWLTEFADRITRRTPLTRHALLKRWRSTVGTFRSFGLAKAAIG